MKRGGKDHRLRRNLQRLLRSMDYVSRHPALKRDGLAARRMAEVYQHLGLAWEFLALQCRHEGGWRRTGEGKRACKINYNHRGRLVGLTILRSAP